MGRGDEVCLRQHLAAPVKTDFAPVSSLQPSPHPSQISTDRSFIFIAIPPSRKEIFDLSENHLSNGVPTWKVFLSYSKNPTCH